MLVYHGQCGREVVGWVFWIFYVSSETSWVIPSSRFFATSVYHSKVKDFNTRNEMFHWDCLIIEIVDFSGKTIKQWVAWPRHMGFIIVGVQPIPIQLLPVDVKIVTPLWTFSRARAHIHTYIFAPLTSLHLPICQIPISKVFLLQAQSGPWQM